jgi:hypothetical protein
LTWKLKEIILKVSAREREREREMEKGIKLYLIGPLKLLLN